MLVLLSLLLELLLLRPTTNEQIQIKKLTWAFEFCLNSMELGKLSMKTCLNQVATPTGIPRHLFPDLLTLIASCSELVLMWSHLCALTGGAEHASFSHVCCVN